jgi:hypothetical protein
MRTRRDATVLFHDGQLFDWLAQREAALYAEIERLDEERLLASSVDALLDYFTEKYKVEPLALDRTGITPSTTTAMSKCRGMTLGGAEC